MAGTNAQLHDDGHVAGFAQLKALLDHIHHLPEFGSRVEQAHAGLERVGVRALLDHACAFAVVFTHNDQHASGHTGRGQIGERIGRHVGAHDGLPGDRAAHGIVERGAQHRSRRGLVRARLDMDTQLIEIIPRLHHHIEQMRDRRPLIAPHIGHA